MNKVLFLFLFLLIIPNVLSINCTIGESQLIYGEEICVANSQTEYGINQEYLLISDIPIKNIGIIIWPSNPIWGWIIFGVVSVNLILILRNKEKELKEKIASLFGFN